MPSLSLPNASRAKLSLAALALIATLPAAHAALTVTNGDFETGIADESTQATVNGWFSVTTGNFFENTWQDSRNGEVPTDSQSGFTGQAAAAFSGIAGDSQPSGLNGSWLYQSIGTDATATGINVTFDWGDFGNFDGSVRDLGLTVSVYEKTGSFTAGDNTDINGAVGVTLLDSASVTLMASTATGTTPKLTIGQSITLSAISQSGGELFLRFNNWDAGNDAPWLMLDNVAISTVTAVPEPSTYAALAGGLALGFVAIRRRRKAA